MTDAPFRVLPALDDDNRFFWTSGADGRLRFQRCQACGYWLHPPAPYCPSCGRREVAPEAVSGRGQVWSFTINHHPWDGSPEPWNIVLVELDEQPGLRLTSNLIGVPDEAIEIGMRVRVAFDERDGIFFPLFEPDAGDA
ncbi:MAG: OB-fold domain-containing protein [Acidimicrobiales bacterium]